ncbi:5-bromo-4-chloroindolyl phosphate hydrolysis family protein [Paracoccus sp. p4-l81]|uniref:5-bromo-4-chloroindolyl phosphate hydrolysis family protein n=1 Tax=Paracoccus sp. p4-l81 TaxID=3342806 RepID=UPI0035B8D8AF
MAQRYGGRFSPNGNPNGNRPGVTVAAQGPRLPARHPLASRVKWLVIAAIPFLLTAFSQGPVGLTLDLAAFGLIALSAFMTAEGLIAEMAYNARRVARRPALPRKGLGAILTGLGLGIGAYVPAGVDPGTLGAGTVGAVLIGIVGTALHMLCFGPDPMRDKGAEGIDMAQQDRVARAIAEGEGYLAQMRDAILRVNDRRLEARVDLFAATARDLFRRIEDDPTDLANARRYLGVYLLGARDATVKFADLYAATRDPKILNDYEQLLSDLEGNYTTRSRALIEGGRSDLTIEIDVLRERLDREGIAPR